MVVTEPDPELPPPPLELIPAGVEVVEVSATPTDDQVARAQVLYIWDHRFADLGALLRRATDVR
ncbi:hypothetical protein [Mycolicibacterium sphagni]|uniref:Uncharacterized protein n=2 Tax=Mycolicibacterium sphagni TaxID=1786 RepID=A0A255DTY1_9MYCO|nr:hypothetical protein [Mycolicibacterium sphagni]OYN82917.1 hypothetical protein CG716_01590 [Mycolicibacterium sphagni]